MEMRGIDVSKFNYISNYDLVAKNCDFVIVRAGGSDNANPLGFYKDGSFEEKYRQLSRRGVPLGAYYVVGHKFTTEADGEIQARNFVGLIRGKKFDFPLFLDYEVPTPAARHDGTTAAIAFCRTLEKLGYYASIYASDISGFKERLELDRLTAFDKWVARYGTKPKVVTKYGIWQYTSTGRTEGVNGNVDMNICYIDYPDVIRKAGLNHLERR